MEAADADNYFDYLFCLGYNLSISNICTRSQSTRSTSSGPSKGSINIGSSKYK